MLDTGHDGIPADEDADDGDQADPDQGLGGVGLRGVPGFDFLEHCLLVCYKDTPILGILQFFC